MIVKLWWRCLWHCSLFWFQASFVPWELSKGPVMPIIVVILIIHGIDIVNISKGHVMVTIIAHWWLILGLLLKHQSKIQNDQNRVPIRTNLNKDVKIWWTALFPQSLHMIKVYWSTRCTRCTEGSSFQISDFADLGFSFWCTWLHQPYAWAFDIQVGRLKPWIDITSLKPPEMKSWPKI